MGVSRFFAAGLIGFSPMATGADLPHWQPVAQGESVPTPRRRALIVTDTARQRLVLFGGTSTGALGDTWEWDGSKWQFITSDGPGSLESPAMAYDTERGVVVLFGGNRDHYSDQTWEYDGATWRMVAGTIGYGNVCRAPDTVAPVALVGASMAFDPVSQRVLLFGGVSECHGNRWETWAWDGVAWALVSATGPARRNYAQMVNDSDHGRVILFGGQSDSPDPGCGGPYLRGDTWTWDGTSWSPIEGKSPRCRAFFGAAFDSRLACMVVHGGGEVTDTPTLHGNSWALPSECGGPAARFGSALAFDPVRQRIIMFGGEIPRYHDTSLNVNDMLEFVADAAPCIGDLNADSVVDDADFVIFAAAYDLLYDPSGNFTFDDCETNDADFVIFAAAYDALVCP